MQRDLVGKVIHLFSVHSAPDTFSVFFNRAGTLWQHDPCLLQGGRGRAGRLRHDQAVHVSGRPQVERRPGLKGEAQEQEKELWKRNKQKLKI